MARNRYLRNAFSFSCSLLLVGCNVGESRSGGATATGTTSSTTTPLPTPSQKNMYVVQAGRDPISTLVFPTETKGSGAPSLEIPGAQVSVDGAGDIYVVDQKSYPPFAVTSINVYSPVFPTGNLVRSLPVGLGTKIAAVVSMAVSAAGDIFVNDGTGIAVFSPTATGNADPVRYIQASGGTESGATLWALYMAVDASGNLYVESNGDLPVSVFGPKDTGPTVPFRTIAGPLTQLGRAGCAGVYAIFGITVDASGDIYTLHRCVASLNGPSGPLTVSEFAATANGNVAPIRSVTTAGLGNYYAGTGVAVDSAGSIYVSASYGSAAGLEPAVVEFAATASGTVTPSNVVTSSAWTLLTPPTGVDDWFDPSGSIALH